MSNLSATNNSKNEAKRIKGQSRSVIEDIAQQDGFVDNTRQEDSVQQGAIADTGNENDKEDKVRSSFGAMLQQARLNQQLSLDNVSAELFILPRHLQALEEEQFDALPQAAFARGFAINYAKFLGLNSGQIASLFDAAYPKVLKQPSGDNIVTPLQTMGTVSPNLNNRMRLNPLLIVAVAALIILVIFLSRMVSNARQEPEAVRPLAEDLTAQAQEQGAAVSMDTNELSASGSTVGNTALEMILTDTTTVDITDATGSSLIAGSQTRGNYKLMGTPPFKIDIANIDNVSLLLNQEPVSLSDYVTESETGAEKQVRFELTL